MSTLVNIVFRNTGATLGFLAISTFAFGQTQDSNVQAPQTGGFKRVGDPSQTSSQTSTTVTRPVYGTDSNEAQAYPADGGMQGPPMQQQPYPQNGDPGSQQSPQYGAPQYGPPPQNGPQPNGPGGQTGMRGWQQPQYTPQQPQYAPPQQPIPAQLMIKQGTFVTVRVNQPLSSDHNQAGDAFTATLVRPIVVDGVVVAERGETIGGRITEADKGGRVKGVSRLGIQLTDLTLADGQQVTLQSQFINRKGSTSVGRDAAGIGTTTALGAAIGAAADWGTGAAIGAGAGAAAGVLGVLLTRGNPTVIYPEQVLTFRVEAPITVSTERGSQAFRWVEPGDYDQAPYQGQGPQMSYGGAPPPAYYGGGYGAYYGPGYYPGYYSPYFWGPSFSFFAGPGYFYGHGYYRGGYYGAHGYYGGGRAYFSGGSRSFAARGSVHR